MPKALTDRNFEMLETNGIRLRTVVEGDGPLVILLHGFPQCWYLWRHQIDPLVEAGWKVAVPDLRGYGGSDRPPRVDDYGIVDLAADVDGLATALGHDDYALAIHDWGAIVGWHVALLYPERVRAVAGLSVPYVRDPAWPAMCTQDHWGERFFYWVYIQEEGRAEAELEADVRSTLARMYVGAAGDRPRGSGRPLPLDKHATLLAGSPPAPSTLPRWLTAKDLDYYVAQFEHSGFRGGLNYYRNIPRLLELTPQLEGVKVRPPTTFTIGRRDAVRRFIPVEGMEERFEDLRQITWVDDVGHWLQLEATEQVNAELVSFLAEFR